MDDNSQTESLPEDVEELSDLEAPKASKPTSKPLRKNGKQIDAGNASTPIEKPAKSENQPARDESSNMKGSWAESTGDDGGVIITGKFTKYRKICSVKRYKTRELAVAAVEKWLKGCRTVGPGRTQNQSDDGEPIKKKPKKLVDPDKLAAITDEATTEFQHYMLRAS